MDSSPMFIGFVVYKCGNSKNVHTALEGIYSTSLKPYDIVLYGSISVQIEGAVNDVMPP